MIIIKKKRKFLTSMILDDLIHSKLAQGMIALNLRGDNYLTDVGDKVIKLMGFRGMQNEIVFMHYLKLLEKAKYVSLDDGNGDMKKLAAEIYEEIRKQKPIKNYKY